MIGIDQSGILRSRSPRPTRWSQRSLSVDELTGSGPKGERNAAIVILSDASWSAGRIAAFLGVSESLVYQVILDFKREVLKRAE